MKIEQHRPFLSLQNRAESSMPVDMKSDIMKLQAESNILETDAFAARVSKCKNTQELQYLITSTYDMIQQQKSKILWLLIPIFSST